MSQHNRAYWTKRQLEAAQHLYDFSADKMAEELRKIYSSMSKQMAEEVEKIYFKLLEDNITRTDIWTYKHYRDLSKRMAILAARVGVKEEQILNTQLEIALKEIYKDTPIPGVSFSLLDEAMVKQLIARPWSEKHFSQAVWDNKAKMLEKLKKGITESIVLGKSKDRAVADIRDMILKEKPGRGFSGAFADADRLVRTELMHTINEGQRQKYKDGGYTQLEIIVADDERTCEECMGREGMIIPIDSPDIPPFHSRCRCSTIPVIDWEDTNMRATENKKIETDSIPEKNIKEIEKLQSLKPPKRSRHVLAALGKNSQPKNKNTIIMPGVDYIADIEKIKKGLYNKKEGKYIVGNRMYTYHDDIFYPDSGEGFITLTRPEYAWLVKIKTEINNPKLNTILYSMGATDEDIERMKEILRKGGIL